VQRFAVENATNKKRLEHVPIPTERDMLQRLAGAPHGMLEGRAANRPLFLMEAAMRKHRDFEDLPCFRRHA
jgi:hypothetical protein